MSKSFLPPIPELEGAANFLNRAVDEIVEGDHDVAHTNYQVGANMMVSRGLVGIVKNARKLLNAKGSAEEWAMVYGTAKSAVEAAEELLPLTMDDGSFYLCEKDRENIKQAGDLMRKIDEKLKEIEKEEDAKK